MGDSAEQRPVVIVERWSGVQSVQDAELVTQDDDLKVFGAAGTYSEAGKRREEAVQNSIHTLRIGANFRCSTATSELWAPTGPAVRTQDRVEEPSRRRSVASLRHVHIDDLTVLIDRPVDVPPLTGDLDVGLVHEPPITHRVSAWPGRVDQYWCEALDPAVDGDVINLDSSLG